MIVNQSPAAWAAPGWAQVALQIIFSPNGLPPSPIPLNIFLNNYAPISDQTLSIPIGTIAAANSTYTIVDTTHTTFLLMILPPNNATALQYAWHTGDTGSYVNPQGCQPFNFDLNHIPSTLYFTTASLIAGVRFLAW